MTRTIRRLVLAVAAAMLCAGAGSALVASSALAAGGIGGDGGLWGSITNLTPYTWTVVEVGGPHSQWQTGQVPFPNTVQPGQTFVYENKPYNVQSFLGHEWDYSGWFTYKAQVLGGGTEYLTVVHIGCQCTGNYQGNWFDVSTYIYDTTAPPPPSWDPNVHFSRPPPDNPAAITPQPQIAWSQSNPIYSDAVFFPKGNFSVDASKDPAALGDVLNALCDNGAGTTCSFTPSGPLTWGIGAAVKKVQATNCTIQSGSNSSSSVSPTVGVQPPAPPPLDPNWSSLEYTESQSASLTVGGGVTVSTEANLFDTIASEISIKVEAEHEWTQTKSLLKSSLVYIPSDTIATIWLAPVEAKVLGTLVVSTAQATFTITNFGETRSGVSRDDLTPAFNVITTDRKLTAAEYQAKCINHLSAPHRRTVGKRHPTPRPKHRQATAPRPSPLTAASLYLGRGVARAKLGESQSQIARRMGQPLFKTASADDCHVLDPRCQATAATRDTWAYRQIQVVFSPAQRVDALVYSGPQKSAKGVGVGTSLAQFREAYPHASCTRYAVQTDCAIAGTDRGRSTVTVFHFIPGGAADRVIIFFAASHGPRGRSRA